MESIQADAREMIASMHAHAAAAGAQITSAPKDYPYGERQYSALDLAGHRWTFS